MSEPLSFPIFDCGFDRRGSFKVATAGSNGKALVITFECGTHYKPGDRLSLGIEQVKALIQEDVNEKQSAQNN